MLHPFHDRVDGGAEIVCNDVQLSLAAPTVLTLSDELLCNRPLRRRVCSVRGPQTVYVALGRRQF